MKPRIIVDFNSPFGSEKVPLSDRHFKGLNEVKDGLEVILYEPRDIAVDAVLKYDEQLKRWFGVPDWSTRREMIEQVSDFLPGFPKDLSAVAFRAEYPKGAAIVAWKFPEALRAISWLEKAGYAVCETDYYQVNDLTDPKAIKEVGYGMAEFYDPSEGWESYVTRCAEIARKTAEPKETFRSIDPGNLYLSLYWVEKPRTK